MYNDFKQLIVRKEDKILTITFNNPTKKNSFTRIGYEELTRALVKVNSDEDVSIVVLTGTGDYFTAGNNLTPSGEMEDMETYIKDANAIFRALVTSFIECNKLIFCLINGPAIGIGATIVGLSDVAWCAEEAYFLTPFTKLGLVPEACSSFMFPLILGRSKASEMILLNEKLTAQEAYQYHFVSRVFKLSELDSVIWPKIREYSKFPPNSMRESKRLVKKALHDNLIRARDAECEILSTRYYDSEFIQAIFDFGMRKSSKL